MPVMSHMSSNGSTFYQMFTPSSCALGSSLGFLDGKKDFPQLGPKISSPVISPNSTQYDRPPVFVAAPHQILVPPNKYRQTHPKRYVYCCRSIAVFSNLFSDRATWPRANGPTFFWRHVTLVHRGGHCPKTTQKTREFHSQPRRENPTNKPKIPWKIHKKWPGPLLSLRPHEKHGKLSFQSFHANLESFKCRQS